MRDLEKNFVPAKAEAKWFPFWEESGFFKCHPESGKKPYCIMMPPPNVTGVLHMGHALDNIMPDILIRYHRMKGRDVLWQSGVDHAGIATQVVVEKLLAKEGKSRHELGREKTLERIWEWKHQYGDTIINQLKRMGCSADYSRSRFTMDEGFSRAVLLAFIHLHKKGFIYRGKRMINWCVRCATALSDEESPHEKIKGSLYDIRYAVKGRKDAHITVTTTRPETMLGDTAVAVNPKDERYKDFPDGTILILPILNREIPLVRDDYVDLAFGSGAVKVTPAHDPNDYEMGQRHKLADIVVIGENGKMTLEAGPYAGMERFACRKKLVEDLKEQGFLTDQRPHEHEVKHCDRCHSVVEPYLSLQWFMAMKDLAKPAIEAARSGDLKFDPPRWSKVYFDWMENIRDWCISRQLWWGHQIPAWHCADCLEITVPDDPDKVPEECGKCWSKNIKQDPDVLDTWFSSQLWPFATLGWPDKTRELERYYPGALISNAREIIFLWDARMIMMGFEFMGGIPFEVVNIHATVLDSLGRRMSKSLGNGINPLELIDKYGADALRFYLAYISTGEQDIKFSEDRLEMGQKFANKIWNAARYCFLSLSDENGKPLPGIADALPATLEKKEDRWILHRLNKAIADVQDKLDAMRFHDAASAMYKFFWNDFCDWYLEISKARTKENPDASDKQTAQKVLYHCLDRSLKILHPAMPFVTEEIWRVLTEADPKLAGNNKRSIMVQDWPEADGHRIDDGLDAQMEYCFEVIRVLRNVRAINSIPDKTPLGINVREESPEKLGWLEANKAMILDMANLSGMECGAQIQRPPKSAMAVVFSGEVFIPLGEIIDLDLAREKISKEIAMKENGIQGAEKKLNNEGFRAKAKPEVIAAEEARCAEMREQLAKLQEALKAFEG